LGGRPFGYIASLSYRNTYEYFEGGQRGLFRLRSTASTTLDAVNRFVGDGGENNVLWGGLLKLSYKPFDRHKFSVNIMRNQSGSSYGETFSGWLNNESGYNGPFSTTTTGYIERGITVSQLQGDHAFGVLRADWIASYAAANQYEPDLRFFAYQFEPVSGDTTYAINPSNGYEAPLRFYRDLNETNLDLKLNLHLPLPGLRTEKKGEFSFGGAYTSKVRDFGETRFEIIPGREHERFDGNVPAFLDSANFLSVPLDENGNLLIRELYEGLYYQDQTQPTNVFDATQDIIAAYGMVEVPLGLRLKFVGGARFETTSMIITPKDSSIFRNLQLEDTTVQPGVLDLTDVLPAASVIFAVSEKMNIRGAYSRTLARPSIVEFSPFQRLPYIGGPVYEGNPNLKRTLIDNVDLRWEWFF
ncbi:MAG: hypothetical protein D6722_21840, partial [Bacteroidetes bacterium]